MMMTNFAYKVIKNLGVLHIFLMEFWMIRMTFDDGNDVFLMVITQGTTFVLMKMTNFA